MRVKGRRISGGTARGKAMVTKERISFLGGVDPGTGVVTEHGHGLFGRCIKGRVLFFPKGKGSTVGSYVLYQMKKDGTAPAGIVNIEAEQILACGAIIAGIPMLDRLERDPEIHDGDEVFLNATEGYLEVLR